MNTVGPTTYGGTLYLGQLMDTVGLQHEMGHYIWDN